VNTTALPQSSSGISAVRRLSRFRFRELTLVPVIVAAVIVGTLVSDAFLTKSNILNILQQSSELSIVVIAEAIILIVGRFDLSLESIVGLAPMVAAWLVLTDTAIGGSGVGLNGYLAIVVILLIGMAVGAANGFFVVKMKLNAFIVTLAMLILLRGITLGLTNGKTLFGLPEPMLYLGTATWFTIPVSIWLAALLYVVFGLILRFHRWGRSLYAIGGNPEAARAAGIQVERTIWIVFVVAGALAALAGLMLTGRIASVVSTQGQNLIFTVFAAAVIGGISLDGGKGSLLGALTGVLLLGVVQNILTLSNIAAFWIDATFGAIILIALVLSSYASRARQEE
jgi:simple sugar transport system permease protein